jgi:hypothetical protein
LRLSCGAQGAPEQALGVDAQQGRLEPDAAELQQVERVVVVEVERAGDLLPGLARWSRSLTPSCVPRESMTPRW